MLPLQIEIQWDLNNEHLEVQYSDHPLLRCPVPITYQANEMLQIVRYSDPHWNKRLK